MKSKIREQIKAKRDSLSKEELLHLSKLVIENLSSIDDFNKRNNIMFYISKDNEVHTHNIIKSLMKKKKIIVPITDKNSLIASELTDFSNLKLGPFSVLEPTTIKEISPDDIDIVIIPGVAFDRNGNRVGYGKGYYDIFLKKTNALKIALAFDFQVVDKIETSTHDVSVDIIVTEKEIIKI